MIGKRILVGLTYLDENERVSEQVQFYGVIDSIKDNSLVINRSDDEGDFSIPYDGELNEADPEAVYTLRATGEEVTGVNYVSTFTIHKERENDL